MARQLAARGVTVAASARSADKLAALSGENAAIRPYPLDVTDKAAVAETFARIKQEIGQVDLVIAGAGGYEPVDASDIKPDVFADLMRVNYLGVVNVVAAVLPEFRARRQGHLSWIASVIGYRGLPKAAAYGPTKAALINLAECLKPELDLDQVKLTVINPGFVRTPMTAVNDFEMPFLMEPSDAAAKAIQGLRKGKFEVAFPSPFVVILKCARLLPYAVFFPLIRKYVLKQKSN